MHSSVLSANAPVLAWAADTVLKISSTFSSSVHPAVSSEGSNNLPAIRACVVPAPLRAGDSSSTGDGDGPPASGSVGPSGV